MNTRAFSPEQLRQAADLIQRILILQEQLKAILAGDEHNQAPPHPRPPAPRRKFSQQAIENIRAGARKRWAAYRKPPEITKARQPRMTEAGRRALAAAAKARWAKAKAAGKNAL